MAGIIGTKTITKTGSFAAKFIPSLHILVEDQLAQLVVDCAYEGGAYISRKYIFSGVWANQASCLYGFFTYGMELDSLQIPSFGIVAIVDGDIADQSIEKRVKDVIKGNHKNSGQNKIIEKISNSITSFNLEFKIQDVNGLPEYNHKKWFEEITKEMILAANTETRQGFVQYEREVSCLLELIEFSKSISDDHPSIKNEKGKSDYHKYYEIIKEDFRPKNTDHKMKNLPWYILSCIRFYNNKKWLFYVKDVKDKINSAYDDHGKRFIESHFDFR